MSRETQIKAMQMALDAHKGQMYGDKDYSYHLASVVEKCKEHYESCVNAENLIAVAWLHDTLEDTPINATMIYYRLGAEIANTVVSVTKVEGESYNDYIHRVKNNSLGLKVKIADTLCNLEESSKIQDQHRIKRYTKQLQLLTE